MLSSQINVLEAKNWDNISVRDSLKLFSHFKLAAKYLVLSIWYPIRESQYQFYGSISAKGPLKVKGSLYKSTK
jgi:hypothetical protein